MVSPAWKRVGIQYESWLMNINPVVARNALPSLHGHLLLQHRHELQSQAASDEAGQADQAPSLNLNGSSPVVPTSTLKSAPPSSLLLPSPSSSFAVVI